MKAIQVRQFGPPDVLQIAEVSVPTPSAGEVLVRLHAVGVNPVETYIRAGTYAKLPPLPYTPGNDGAGVVEALGEGVRGFAKGDRVYLAGSISGTYAELALVRAADIYALPGEVSFVQGAALGVPYTTAYRALMQRGGAVAGEKVLIHGATGGVGLAAVQMARAAGLKVFATGGSEAGRRVLREQGADEVFDHKADGYLDAIREKSGGLNLIIEMLANENLGHDLTLLAMHGRVLVVGSRGPLEINPRETMIREADIRGVMVAHASRAEVAEIHEAIRLGLVDRTLRPVIAAEFPLADAPKAHAEVMSAHAPGKIVLLP